MTATTQSLASTPNRHLRPLRIQRDLGAVADLVELCFAETLDVDGRRYIRQMRAAARSPYKTSVASRISPDFTGFIWEQDRKVVGNVNLLPVTVEGKPTYMIANVAVHPDYRRQGIARALTEAGLNFIRAKGVKTAWLQVNHNNPAAIHLYQGFGFVERSRRTTWHSPPRPPVITLPDGVSVKARQDKDWLKQAGWLERLYPGEVRWHLAIQPSYLSPGLGGCIRRLFADRRFKHWSAYRKGSLIGALWWQSSYSQADWLWLAAPPEDEDLAIYTLLPYAQDELAFHRTLALNYPAGRGEQAFAAARFSAHQTLIWMQNRMG